MASQIFIILNDQSLKMTWLYELVRTLVEKVFGLVFNLQPSNTKDSCNLGYDDKMTRVQFVTILGRAAGIKDSVRQGWIHRNGGKFEKSMVKLIIIKA